VSFETSFDSKQPKLEPKQTKDKPKQFDREHILQFFTEIYGFFGFFGFFGFLVFFLSIFSRYFRFFLGFFGLFRNSLFPCYGCFASIPKQRISISPKQTEDPPKQFKREYIWVFFRKFRVVSVCFGLLRNSSVVRNTETNRNFLLLVSRNKPKQTRNRSCFGLFRFEPKIIFVCFEDTLGGMSRGMHCTLLALA
jgi:hypothetical protein